MKTHTIITSKILKIQTDPRLKPLEKTTLTNILHTALANIHSKTFFLELLKEYQTLTAHNDLDDLMITEQELREIREELQL